MTATECQGHKHLGKCEECGKPLIWIEKWQIEAHDDGSICPVVVQPVKSQWTSVEVLAVLLNERSNVEAEIRRNTRGKKKRGG